MAPQSLFYLVALQTETRCYTLGTAFYSDTGVKYHF